MLAGDTRMFVRLMRNQCVLTHSVIKMGMNLKYENHMHE